MLPLGSKGIWDRAFSRYGVATLQLRPHQTHHLSATVVMQILLMVGGFDVDRDTELTLVNVNINIQVGDMELEGVPGEVDRIVTVEPFKEGDEGVWTKWPE